MVAPPIHSPAVQPGGRYRRRTRCVPPGTRSARNGPFLAMRVPAGTHRVRLRYRPPGWTAGLWIAAATALLVLGGQVSKFHFAPGRKSRPDPMAVR